MKDYIRVGGGILLLNDKDETFLLKRGGEMQKMK